jgi:hypothetical protein
MPIRLGKGADSPTPTSANSSEINPGITLLKILIIAVLCIVALNAAYFAVEAWNGTLDTYALRRFVPKALFGLVFIGYVLRKMKTKTSF